MEEMSASIEEISATLSQIAHGSESISGQIEDVNCRVQNGADLVKTIKSHAGSMHHNTVDSKETAIKIISSSHIYLVQVTSDKTYEARFTYPINVHCEISVTKNSLGKPLGTTSAGSFGTSTGNAVTIVATPNFGNQFVHWLDLDTGEILSTKTAYLFPAKRDMRIMAVFKPMISIIP